MKKTLSVVALLFATVFTFPAFADGPKGARILPNVKIEGAEVPVPYGELVQINVNAQDKVENLFSSKYSWKVYDNNYQPKKVYTSGDGKTIMFGAGIKKAKFLVVLDATYTFVDKDAEGKIVGVETLDTGISDVIVQIGDAEPPPPPDDPDNPPTPPTPPTPPKPLPDSPLGLVKPSVDAYKTMKSESRATVAKLVAANYANVKNRIAAQEIRTLKDAYAELSRLNGESLRANKADFAEWNAWDNAVKKGVYDLYLAKKLVAIEDYIGAYAEIADSLNYAAEIK